MNVTREQLEALARQLAEAAAIFSPASAGAIIGIVNVATELNTVVHEIKSQTDANAQQVWDHVRTDFADSVAAFEDSVQKHPGA